MIKLSQKATIPIKKTGDPWQIKGEGKQQEYIIIKKEDKLNVYQNSTLKSK
jgi:hypothetical protein